MLDESLVQVGGRYRGRSPVKVRGQFRDLWDDRTVVWIGPSRLALEYEVAHGTQTKKQGLTMSEFLEWAGRVLGEEEGSDVK